MNFQIKITKSLEARLANLQPLRVPINRKQIAKKLLGRKKIGVATTKPNDSAH